MSRLLFFFNTFQQWWVVFFYFSVLKIIKLNFYVIVTWEQDADCNCCQPVDFRKLQVELTCEDGKRFKKKITVPAICSCESCPPDPDKLSRIKKINFSSDLDNVFSDNYKS